MKLTYPAVFYQGKDGDYAVEFPDLPGCVSGGYDMREALKWGIDAACGWILGEWERGRAINRPSPISEIRPDETEQAESFVRLVTLDMDAYAIKYSK